MTQNRIAAMVVMCVAAAASAVFADDPPSPTPRPLVRGDRVLTVATDRVSDAIRAAGDATLDAADGVLRMRVTGEDPQLIVPDIGGAVGPIVVTLKARAAGGGMGQVFWSTTGEPGFSEERSVRFEVVYDGTWRTYQVALPVKSGAAVTALRLDLASAPGHVDVGELTAHRGGPHPLHIAKVAALDDRVKADLVNDGDRAIKVSWVGRTESIAAGGRVTGSIAVDRSKALQRIEFIVEAEGLPTTHRDVWVHRADAAIDAVTMKRGELRIEVAKDGSLARIYRNDELAASLAPLAIEGREAVRFAARLDDGAIRLESESVTGDVRWKEDDVLSIDLASTRVPIDGPVLRVAGSLRQAVLPGVEYLGAGERSSSKLDIHTERSDRYWPAARDLTWPGAAIATDRATVAWVWHEPAIAVTFASPDFVDGGSGHRVSLRGPAIATMLRVSEPGPVTEAIAWAVNRLALPPLPDRPRDEAAQAALCMRAFDGPLRSERGWGHCVEPQYARRWYADHASTIWRLTGKTPQLPEVAAGGGHLTDDRIYLLTARGEAWVAKMRGAAERAMAAMKDDGSFRYDGPYREGHDEDTASGYCAHGALPLLRWARYSGDAAAKAAGLAALRYMTRFDTPRGAQTWELSLHTPDILASAQLVEANLIGYELTGDKRWLGEARRWGLSGLAFVYLWGDRPTMAYATIPVLGASSYVAPHWIGVPVQWCGLVYADAIAQLAAHDATVDWRRIAQGIVIAAERMQETAGDRVGCLPDYWSLAGGTGLGPAINPSGVVIAGDRAWSRPTGVQVAVEGTHRIASPYPVRIDGADAMVRSQPGARYQVVIDGTRVVDVAGSAAGEDRISLR